METPKRELYQFGVYENLPPLMIHKDILPYFVTLESMVKDLDESILPSSSSPPLEQSAIIYPLPEFIDRDVMQWIIDAYLIYHTYGTSRIITFDDLYDYYELHHKLSVLLPPETDAMLRLFGKNSERPTKDDIPELLTIVLTLNWLNAERLLVLTLDKVYELIKGLATKSLGDALLIQDDTLLLLNMTSDKKQLDPNGLPFTPYYKRENLVYTYLAQRLPLELLRSKLRVQEYVNPLQCGVDHQFFLAKGNLLYGAGENAQFQLGVQAPVFIDGTIKILKIDNGNPVLITCGGDHTLCLTDRNLLYACGLDRYGELGIGNRKTINGRTLWTKVSVGLEGEILLIETCHQHTMIVTTLGLYACGNNKDGQLGLGDTENRSVFTRVLDIQGDVLDVSCGTTHTVILTTKGVYGCGSNEHGQLDNILILKGSGSTRFQRIDMELYGIPVSIACGTYHTAVVTSIGLFVCGASHEGQLGLGDEPSSMTRRFTQVFIDDESPITVYCADSYTVVLTKSGNLYGAGRNIQGNLANGELQGNVLKFTRMQGVKGKIYALNCCYDRVFLLTSEGLFQSGEQVWIPVDQPTTITEEVIMNFTEFTKLKLDLGYTLKDDDDDSEETLGIQLRCDQCHGNASFSASIMSNTNREASNMFFCSKYCFYKSNQDQ
jgi:alpha-tubulin suppressor-like RCC1 family protein